MKAAMRKVARALLALIAVVLVFEGLMNGLLNLALPPLINRRPERIRVVFDSAPFRGLGAVSFGVYLYHLPIQHVTARVMERVSLAAPDHALLFGAASLVATIVERVVWEVVPALAETMIREELKRLTAP